MKTLINYIFLIFSLFNLSAQETDFEYLFAHGLAAGKIQLKDYKEIIPILDKGLALDCIDAYTKPLYPYLIKVPPCALGQEKDIEVLSNAINNLKKPIIAIGVSKGAATWINVAAKSENINYIKALVLESPFANINDILYRFWHLKYLNYIPGGRYIAKQIIKAILVHYDCDGIQPIGSIKKILNKNLPIYIVHSKQDRLIPINHSRQLYIEFLKNDFKNVYLIEPEVGHHAGILYTDELKTFQNSLNSFYKEFKLPYNANIAIVDLNIYKPTIQEVIKRIENDTNSFEEYKPLIIKLIIVFLIFLLILKHSKIKKIF